MKKNCEICGKEMVRKGGVWSNLQWSLRRFCSAKCFGIQHSKTMKGKPGPKGYKHTLETRKRMSLGKLALKKKVWFGTKNQYRRLHIWVEEKLGKPDKCEGCGKSGLFGKKIHWANKSHRYLKRLSDWIRLCTLCHSEYDKKHWQSKSKVV